MRGLLKKLLGDQGERSAARYLRRQGFKILARQYRTHWGEIDLVCLDGDRIVFVEVKTRRSNAAGHPFEAVDQEKQKKLTRMALAYLKRHNWLERSARFDVVSIIWADGQKHPEIEHFRDAFPAAGFGQMYS